MSPIDATVAQARAEVTAQHPGINLKQSQRLGVWFLVLSLLIGLLVTVGGVVRLSGSGLSIPEWPLINGSLLPPLTKAGWNRVYSTYYHDIHGIELQGADDSSLADRISLGRFQLMFAIEYTHRLLAALVSILFLALFTQVWRQPAWRAQYGKRLYLAAALLLFQAILGGIVVKFDLQAEFVAVHLGVAFFFFSLVFWLALLLLRPPPMPRASAPRSQRLLVVAALIIVYLQILSGGLVASTHAGYLFNTWPKMGDGYVPESSLLWSMHFVPTWLNLLKNPILIQFMHRWWAVLAVVVCISLIVASFQMTTSTPAKLALRALASLIVAQFMLGIMTLISKVAPPLALLHLVFGFLIFATLVAILYEYKYHCLRRRVTA